ncbi:VanZ family protein [Corynebacterium frankenforstense]
MPRPAHRPLPLGPVIACLLPYAAVILSLTTLKAFFAIGYLWHPEKQRVRELRLIPFEHFFTSSTWFGPIFDAVGNLAFFVPFGWLVAIAVERVAYNAAARGGRLATVNPVRIAAWTGFAFSLCIEITQFIFALGRTDVDDLIFNTLGAALGAWLAGLGGRWWRWLLVLVTAAAVVTFVVLVLLGQRLGDPDKVVETASALRLTTPAPPALSAN